ncbi:MAG TPA: PAS domain-containing protein [Allocoleopsis sp.]
MQEFLSNVLFPTQFIPHGHCYLWQPGLVWLHFLSDLLIAIAYYSIPLLLIYFVRQREDVPFRGIFLLFGAFIISCGTTHMMNLWTLWHPSYWLAGAIKAITAFVSCYTALELVPIIPQALAMPSPAKLEATNRALEREITERQQAEAEIRRLNVELEARVQQRTAQLEASNQEKEALLQREQEARALAETARQDSQLYAERLALALDAAKMGSWDWDFKSDRVFWNPRHEILLGYPPGTPERSYEEWSGRIHPDDLVQAEADIRAALTNYQQDYFSEYRILLPDGTPRWLRGFGRLFRNSSGEPVRMAGVIFDVTERYQAEVSLRDSEERFRATFEQAAVGIAHVELDGSWMRVNQRLCDILGYTRDEILQLTFQDITHPEDLRLDLSYAQQLLQGEIENYSLEKRYICKDGSIIWANLTASLVREQPGVISPESDTRKHLLTTLLSNLGDAAVNPVSPLINPALGEPKYFISVIEEISDRKEAEFALQKRAEELVWANRQLRRATVLLKRRNEELDQFAYVVSHDLKAPLRAIANLSEWIEEDLGEQLPDENRHQMRLMRGRVHRMEALIEGLLEYSRVGRTEIAVETVNVGSLLSELMDSLAPALTFQIEIAPGMPTFSTKRLLLRQVFANLISNAIKHHDRPDGCLKIGVQDLGEHYEFTVADDGPGIDPEHHQRIFGIFQTLVSKNGANKDGKESTGIGLSIVKKIVEGEGGTITLESQIGQGTTFRFTWLKQPKGDDSISQPL